MEYLAVEIDFHSFPEFHDGDNAQFVDSKYDAINFGSLICYVINDAFCNLKTAFRCIGSVEELNLIKPLLLQRGGAEAFVISQE